MQYEQTRDKLAAIGVTDDAIITAILSISDFGSLTARQESTSAAIDPAIAAYRQVSLRNPSAKPADIAYAIYEVGRATVADVALIGTAENLLYYLSQGHTLDGLRKLTPAQQAQTRLDVVAACGEFFCSPSFGVSRGSTSILIPGQATAETAVSGGLDRGIGAAGRAMGSIPRAVGLETLGNIQQGSTIGSLDAVKGFLGGIYNLVAHPINTTIGLSQTIDAIGLYSLQNILGQRSLTSDVAARYSPSTNNQGATGVSTNASHDVVTTLTLFIGAEAAAGRAGEVGNAGRAGEVANVGRAGDTTITGTGRATVDTRPASVPNSVTVTFENAGARLTAAELNQGFRTVGTDVAATRTAAGQQLIGVIESGGVLADDALKYANNFFRSGVRPPAAVPISAGDTLVKLVPRGEPVSPFSGYFLTQSELAALSRNPGQLANRLGLPAGSQALQFDIYQVTARTKTTVFQSRVAPTVNDLTGARTTGGATQTIVGNRALFTDPVRIGTLNGFNPLRPRGN